MFDIDSGKLLIIGIVALVVIGPKELPGVLRQVGNALGKVRRMAAEFQGQFMEAMRESELEELKKDVQKMIDNRKRVGNPVWIASYDEAAASALRAVASRKKRERKEAREAKA
jgi:Tat protein translocase TatB subunit